MNLRMAARFGPLVGNVVFPLVVILAVLALAYLMFSLGLKFYDQLGSGVVPDSDNKYEVLRDTLVIVMTSAALAIAMFGTLVYFLLQSRLRIEVEKSVTESFRRAVLKSMINQGFLLWEQSKYTGESFYLKQAIDVSKEASSIASQLDESIPENEEALCTLRNNWAWYLMQVEEITESEKRQVRWFADYIEQRLGRFESHDSWIDTIIVVREKFPENERSS